MAYRASPKKNPTMGTPQLVMINMSPFELFCDERDPVQILLAVVNASDLLQLKLTNRQLCALARTELRRRIACFDAHREPPKSASDVTDLDVQLFIDTGRLSEVIGTAQQMPTLQRLRATAFVVDLNKVRDVSAHVNDDKDDDDEDDTFLGGVALRNCIEGEGDPPPDLLLTAVGCATRGVVLGVPVSMLRDGDDVDIDVSTILCTSDVGVQLAAMMLRLPQAKSVRVLTSHYQNMITGDAADHLATAVLEHAFMTDFCGIPLASLRDNSITELELTDSYFGVPGAIVLGKLLTSSAALTSLECAPSPLIVRFCVSADWHACNPTATTLSQSLACKSPACTLTVSAR
tara:strand:- start:1179 stop:2219 length:1041 start_codon:yes stop_codon:yes gene_type:complete